MATDRIQSIRVFYPFVPDAAAIPYVDLLKAVRDVRLSADGEGTVATVVYPVTKTHFGVLMSYDHPTTTFVFHAVADDIYFVRTFEIPAGVGLVRVGSTEDSDSFIIVNRDELVAPAVALVPLEIEPACCHWAPLSRVTRMAFYQEYRDSNPDRRPSALPDRLIHEVVGSVLKLADGYNCRLSYEEATGVLYIEGGAALGLGLPQSIPWDSAGEEGVMSFNLERYGAPPDADYEVSEEFTNGADAALIVESMVRDNAGMSFIVKVDDVAIYSSGVLPLSGWERYVVAPVITAGTHTITLEVTGGTSYWGVRLTVGRTGIQSLNGLNNGGNVNIKGGSSLAVSLETNGIGITLLDR